MAIWDNKAGECKRHNIQTDWKCQTIWWHIFFCGWKINERDRCGSWLNEESKIENERIRVELQCAQPNYGMCDHVYFELARLTLINYPVPYLIEYYFGSHLINTLIPHIRHCVFLYRSIPIMKFIHLNCNQHTI